MTGLVRKATLLSAAGLLAASAAMAGVPSALNSITPPCIQLVGNLGGVPDAVGSFVVTVKDLANNPLNGASVVIDLVNASDLALCDDQLDGAALVNCVAKTTRKFTDALGQVTFIVLGGSNGAGNAASFLGAGRIYANGVLIGSPTVSAFDLDGASGVGANDLSAWLTDFGNPPPPNIPPDNWGRSDFDCSGDVGANDLSLWLTQFGAGTSAASCAVSCF